MTYRVELTPTGITLREAAGARIVTETLIRDGDGIRRVTIGEWPPEVSFPREAADHMAALWSRMARSLRFPASAMRSSLPPHDLPQTTSPWG